MWLKMRGAHVEDEALADARGLVSLDQPKAGVEDRDQTDQQREHDDEMRVRADALVPDALVQDLANQQRRDRAESRVDHEQHQQAVRPAACKERRT